MRRTTFSYVFTTGHVRSTEVDICAALLAWWDRAAAWPLGTIEARIYE